MLYVVVAVVAVNVFAVVVLARLGRRLREPDERPELIVRRVQRAREPRVSKRTDLV